MTYNQFEIMARYKRASRIALIVGSLPTIFFVGAIIVKAVISSTYELPKLGDLAAMIIGIPVLGVIAGYAPFMISMHLALLPISKDLKAHIIGTHWDNGSIVTEFHTYGDSAFEDMMRNYVRIRSWFFSGYILVIILIVFAVAVLLQQRGFFGT